MKQLSELANGNILVELSPQEWGDICDGREWFLPTPQEFGRIIRGYRSQNHLTQESLATRVGISRSRLSAVEDGKAEMLWSTFRKIAAEVLAGRKNP